MKTWIVTLLVLLVAGMAHSVPTVKGDEGAPNQVGFEISVSFAAGDTSDSPAISLRGSCTIRATVAGSDVLQAWQVTSISQAASSGTQIGSDITSSTTQRIDFNPGTFWIKVKSSTANTGGSSMKINCSNIASGNEGVSEGAFADLPSDNSTTSVYYVNDCLDSSCNAGGGDGTIARLFEWDGDSWAPVDAAGSVTGLTNPLAADLDADDKSITGAAKLNTTLWPGSTTAVIQAAIDSCQNGTAGAGSDRPSCRVMLPAGRVELSDTLEIGANASVSSAGQYGFTVGGDGAGVFTYEGSPSKIVKSLGGTTLYWGGADGGTMVRVVGFGHTMENIMLDGRSCKDNFDTGGPPQTSGSADGKCDSDGSTTQVQAAYGVEVVANNSTSAPTGKNVFRNMVIVGVQDASAGYGLAFGISDLGQNDFNVLENVRFADNLHCLRQSDSQAYLNQLRSVECTRFTSSPGILVERGGIDLKNVYIGGSLSSGVGVQVDSCATTFNWQDGVVEWTGDNGTVVKFSDTGLGCGTGNRHAAQIQNVRMLMQTTASTEHTCIQKDTRHLLTLIGNTFSSDSSAALRKCDLEFNHSVAGDRVDVLMAGNRSAWNNGGDTAEIAITVVDAGNSELHVMNLDRGRYEITDENGTVAVNRDSTGMYADNNGDGDYDAGTDLRFDPSIFGTGDVTAIGGCATGDCYATSQGSSDTNAIFSQASLSIYLDEDTGQSSQFNVKADSGVNILTATEAGVVTIGATSVDGTLRIYQDDAGGDGLVSIVAPINNTSTVTLPNATSTLATIALTETLTNKTLSTGSSVAIGSGTISGAVVTSIQTGTTHSPTGTAIGGAFHMYTNTAAVTVTLPAISTAGAGASGCFYDVDATADLIIDPDNGDGIRLAGVLDTDGDSIHAGTQAVGDFVCLIAIDNGSTDEWVVLGKSGDWLAN